MKGVLDSKIRRSFSNAAWQYDKLTDLHRDIGRRLTERIEYVEDVLALLDIGMGTGRLTERLATVFPDAMIVGLDFASGMISCARQREGGFKIVQADAACLPFKEGVFDIITSNLAYQWVEDLPRAFTLCRSRLSQRGRLYLTMFGRNTFDELFVALDACVGEKDAENGLTIRRLANKKQIAEALKSAGFNTIRVEAENIRVHIPDMMSLTKWIKGIGANTLPKDIYVGKDLFLRADQYYNKHFRDSAGVYATFEAIWVEARK